MQPIINTSHWLPKPHKGRGESLPIRDKTNKIFLFCLAAGIEIFLLLLQETKTFEAFESALFHEKPLCWSRK